MPLRITLILSAIVLFEFISAAPANDAAGSAKIAPGSQALEHGKDDLKTAASSGYPDRYSDWGRGYSSGYGGVTGYGSLDDRYGGYGGYDSPYGYNGFEGDYSRYGGAGYSGTAGYGGYRGGYGGGSYGYGGNGGYGGYSGNGGLNSYYGYNNPYYQSSNNHLGYGYYKRPGYGNIYGSGITPSLVTGYRGYSKK
ncbi:uncharacterized protein LOC142973010 [Anticarsia gemmatalis]|uniref:uncharacterized protein LOC142973010 n=1 Tax=Anticarsia gemmatalis TaxID=129554 RepID=UPI003F770EFC